MMSSELTPLRENSMARPVESSASVSWFKRIGILGFLFFLIKGLAWLIVPALIARGCAA